MNENTFIRERLGYSILLFLGGVMGAMLVLPLSAHAATTIGNNVSVGGTLTVTGATTVTSVSSTNIDATGYVSSTNITANGTLTVDGATTLNGAVTLGDAGGDALTFTGRIASDLTPTTTNNGDLGSYSYAWKDVYASGSIFAGDLYVDGNLSLNNADLTVTNVSSTNIDATGYVSSTDMFLQDDLALRSDAAVVTLGADNDVSLTHVDNTGILLNSTNKIQFNDATQFIQGASATVLALGATDEIDLTATTMDINGTVDISGNSTIGASTASSTLTVYGATTITGHTKPEHNNKYDLGAYGSAWKDVYASGSIFAGDLYVDGSLTLNNADLTLTNVSSTYIDSLTYVSTTDMFLQDDLALRSDAAIVTLGADNDVSLTHVADTGILLNSAMKIQFNDASQFIQGTSATVLALGATDEIDLTATAMDINGTVNISGNSTIGASTASSTLTVYGATTITGHTKPEHNNGYDLGAYGSAWKDVYASGTIYSATSTVTNITGTSTLYISSRSGTLGGRIVLEDSDGGGCTVISALDGTLTAATVTCP